MSTCPERTIAVLVPAWPVLAAGVNPRQPAVTVDRQLVSAYNTSAGALGVRRGQRVREAQRLCPELEVHRADPVLEARVFEPIVLALESAAVGIEIARPGLCLLRADGPGRYYGGESETAAVLRDAVAAVQIGTSPTPVICGIGIADGSFTAVLAARLNAAATIRTRFGEGGVSAAGPADYPPPDEPLIVPPGGGAGFLAPYPLRVFELPEFDGILGRLGIRTLGALAALPVADVANRFGPVGVQAHRLARGLDPRPPVSRRPDEDLSALHLFQPPAERDEPVVFAAKALADDWRARLAAAGLTCASVRIELVTESGAQCVRSWRDGDALGSALSAQALAQRVRWQLDGWRTRTGRPAADSGSDPDPDRDSDSADFHSSVTELAPDPLVSLRLIPGPLTVDSGSQQALWGREAVPDRIGRVAERVQAMLGHDGVTLLHEVGGRDPAARIDRVPWGEPPAPDPAADPDAPWPGAVPEPAPPLVPEDQHPVLLLDAKGEHIGVAGRVRLTARPAHLVLGGTRLPITAWAGPWPYHERPWRPADSRRVARIQLSTADGRAFLLALEHGAWRVEGVYR